MKRINASTAKTTMLITEAIMRDVLFFRILKIKTGMRVKQKMVERRWFGKSRIKL